ncbi:hypothetical protein CHLNCDRAFT_7888, partial [Chlorella variabilis]
PELHPWTPGPAGSGPPRPALPRAAPAAVRCPALASGHASYERALAALSSLISGRQRKDTGMWAHAFEMMQSYLEASGPAIRHARLSLEEPLGELSVIHVAGTKGKGSTCAMIERMLREAGYRTGLFTSPHLIDVRERIRINGEPLDRATFLRNLWWIFDKLEEKASDDSGKPAYFRFLTLLCFKVFLEQKVDVVILEVGLGGRLDATNCVRHPVVCGVSSLGFDHMELLGYTLPEIAREKAGIFKPGVPAFTVPQREDAAEALRERAAAVGTPLAQVRAWEDYAGAADVVLGLAGEHQKLNAALAAGHLPPEYVAGLQAANWPGRGHIVHDVQGPGQRLPRLSFFLDGAHTAESMATCAHWFADASQPPAAGTSAAGVGAAGRPDTQLQQGLVTQRILLFNCMQERDPQNLLQPLAQALTERQVSIHHALFVPPDSTYMKLGSSAEPANLTWQHSLRSVWESMTTTAAGSSGTIVPFRTAVLPSLSVTLDWLRRCVREIPNLRMQVLVTGSLYLVGDLLKALQQ